MAATREKPRRVVLDANILILLAYGAVNKKALGKKRRVREYMPKDYDIATAIIGKFQQAVVTPNAVTECSDLMSDTGDNAEKRWLKNFLQKAPEIRIEEYVPSRVAVNMEQYEWLGVADCSLLSLVDKDTVMLTDDAKLHNAAAQINPNCMNFNHYRDFT